MSLGLKRRDLTRTVRRAKPLTSEVLTNLRTLLEPGKNPNLVTWRTVWRAHMEFGLILRFDDVKRLKVMMLLCTIFKPLKNGTFKVSDLSFESNAAGPFIRVRLQGGKTAMHDLKDPDCLITQSGKDACLYDLTVR